ncbi:MAG: hypothetical protein M3355_02320 [Actinomycetota bacterium]|nr:hypothetical protein [Actinomycetota bacterium]
MTTAEVKAWFSRYLDAFAAYGREESDPRSLLEYYAVPLLLAIEDRFVALQNENQIEVEGQQQVSDLVEAGYDHSETLASEITVLNGAAALYRGEFSRNRRDGSEIGRLAATYLITKGTAGTRISAIAVHAA